MKFTNLQAPSTVLKDTAGLKYIEIIEIPPFDNLKLPSLGKLYRDAKVRMQNKRFDGNNGMNEKSKAPSLFSKIIDKGQFYQSIDHAIVFYRRDDRYNDHPSY